MILNERIKYLREGHDSSLKFSTDQFRYVSACFTHHFCLVKIHMYFLRTNLDMYLPVSHIWIWYLLCWFWFHCFYLGFQKLLSKLFSKGSDIRHCWVSCLMKLVCSFILHFFNTFIEHLMKIKIILLKVKFTTCLPRVRFNMKKYLCTCIYIYI